MAGKWEFWTQSCTGGIRTRKVGFPEIRFKDGAKVKCQIPWIKNSGKTLGGGTVILEDKLYCVDVENRLYAEVKFGVEEKGLCNGKTGKDKMNGGIWRISKKWAEKL